MKYSSDWFPILYLHSNIPLKLQRKNIEPTVMALSSFSLCGWKCLLWPPWNSTSFQHIFPWYQNDCVYAFIFFRMEPRYLLMVNQDPVLFSLTQRMKFFRAVLVVIKIELTKLFYAIISVVYYQWQKPNYYTNITHLTYTMLVLFSGDLAAFYLLFKGNRLLFWQPCRTGIIFSHFSGRQRQGQNEQGVPDTRQVVRLNVKKACLCKLP